MVQMYRRAASRIQSILNYVATLKFEGLGFKLEGPTIQIILWMLCFLTIVGSIKLLQPKDKAGLAHNESASTEERQ